MADPESQMSPFRPAGVRSDEPPTETIAKLAKRKHEESSKFLVYALAGVVFLGSVILIIATVFLRVNNPKLRLNSPSIQNFHYDRNSTSLNTTISAEVTVNNENFGRYVFDNCIAVVLYGNSTIGGGEISGGRVGGRKTKSMNVVMQLRSENLNFSSGGTDSNELIEIRSYAKMTGRVHVLTIVDRRKTIEMNCTMNLNLNSRSITNSLCR